MTPDIHLQSASYLNSFSTYGSLKNPSIRFFESILGHNLIIRFLSKNDPPSPPHQKKLQVIPQKSILADLVDFV